MRNVKKRNNDNRVLSNSNRNSNNRKKVCNKRCNNLFPGYGHLKRKQTNIKSTQLIFNRANAAYNKNLWTFFLEKFLHHWLFTVLMVNDLRDINLESGLVSGLFSGRR